MSELRQALRGLRRAPGFTAAAVLTLALGVGASTGGFSALYGLLLKPLPYPDAARLVSLHETTVDRKPRGVAVANLLDWRVRTTAFDGMAAYRPRTFGLTLRDNEPLTVILTGQVMAGFFEVLRVPPALGRSFTEAEEIAEAHVMVLSARMWRQFFAGDPAAVGRVVALNEEPYTIIGIMPAGFEYAMGALPDAFIPLSRKDYCCGRLGSLDAVARLAPGVSRERARTELESAAAALAAEHPASNAGRTAGLTPLQETQTGERREPLLLLAGACLAVLAIACANVAGLVLARRLGRSHETAVRAALGAGTARLARQAFAEAAVLSLSGAAAGLLAAQVVLAMVPRFVPGPTDEPLRLDGQSFAIAAGLASLVTLLLGSVPAVWLRRADLQSLIKSRGAQNTRGGRSRFRSGLAVTQVALSVVLLLSTGVLLRSFLRLTATSPGFETERGWRFGIGLPEKRYDTERKLIGFHRQLLAKLSDLPEVERAAAALRMPLRGGTIGAGGSFQIVGANIPIPQRPRAWVNAASPGYFAAMGIPMLEGREFSWRDDVPAERRVAIVNRAFVRAYLSDRRAAGTLLDIRWVTDLNPPGVPWEIVGVASDTRQANLHMEPIPEIFLSMSQVGSEGAVYVVRGRGETGMAQTIARTVAEVDPRLEKISAGRLSGMIEGNLEPRALAMRLIAGFGALALLLTAVGVYGIVAFRAAQRQREMAIRSALGGTARQIRRLVLGHGARIGVWGTAAGLATFKLVAPLLKGQLYQTEPFDLLTTVAVVLTILGITLAASIAPSRRAAKAVPMEVLRDA